MNKEYVLESCMITIDIHNQIDYANGFKLFTVS